MSQIFDLTAAGPILKQRYESKRVQVGFFEERALLADVPKDETAGGAAFNIAIKYAPMSTRNHTVPGALANGAPDQYTTFAVPNGLYNDYAVVQLSGSAVDQASGDENSMIKLTTEAFDGAYDSAYESQSKQLHGNGGSARGQVGSISGSVITLTQVGSAVSFWPGQVLQASVDDGTGGAGVYTGTMTVQGVDYQGGTVTMTAAPTAGIPGIGVNSYLFMVNDYGIGFVGLAGWNPTTAPTSSSALFFNVPRYINVVGLSGWRFVGNGAAYEDSTTDLTTRMCSMKGVKPNRMYVNPIDWGQWAKTQNSRVIYDRASVPSFSTPELMFEALKMMTP